MTADRSMRVISAAFPALCVLSLALPFGLTFGVMALNENSPPPRSRSAKWPIASA